MSDPQLPAEPKPGSRESIAPDAALTGVPTTPRESSESIARLPDVGLATPDLDSDPETRRVHATLMSKLFGDAPDVSTIGRYAIIGRLGQGAMGVVYACYDSQLDRRIAVKVVRSDVASPSIRARMVREAQAMAKLNHPNVAHVYEVGEHDARMFVAMEYVEGQTLREWQRAEKPGWREVVDAYQQAGRGLAAAHAAGLVHRDFKPDNAVIGADGRVRVLDFGLARAAEVEATGEIEVQPRSGPHDEALAAPLTRTGAIIGTPSYMSAEQFLGEEVTAKSDQFALCVSIWEGLFGERPFAGTTAAELTANVTRGRVREVTKPSSVPASVRDVLIRGLAVASSDRYETIDALLAALARATRRTWPKFGAAIVGVSLAVGTGVLVSDQRDHAASLEAEVGDAQLRGESQRDRAETAELSLHRRADELKLAEATEAARVDTSVALAVLAQVSGESDLWAGEAWTLAQEIAKTTTAKSVYVVPDEYEVVQLLRGTEIALIRHQREEHVAAWWPGDGRLFALSTAAVDTMQLGPNEVVVQDRGQESAVVWSFSASDPVKIREMSDIKVAWSTASSDGRLVMAQTDRGFDLLRPDTNSRQTTPFESGSFYWLSNDGSRAVMAGSEGLGFYDMKSGTQTLRMATHPAGESEGRVDLGIASDGSSAFTLRRGVLTIWETDPGTRRQVEFSEEQSPAPPIFADAGDRMAIGTADGLLQVLDLATFERVDFARHRGPIRPLSWLDGDRQLAAKVDGGIMVFDGKTGTLLASIRDPGGRRLRVEQLENGLLATVALSGIRTYSIEAPTGGEVVGRDLVALDGSGGDGVVTLGADGGIRHWREGRAGRSLGTHEGALAVALSADGGHVVTSTSTNARVWSVADGTSIQIDAIDTSAQPPWDEGKVAVARDGLHVATLGRDGVTIIDTRALEERLLPMQGRTTPPRFAPDDDRLYVSDLSADAGTSVMAWNTRDRSTAPREVARGMFMEVGSAGQVACVLPNSLVVATAAGEHREFAVEGNLRRVKLSPDGTAALLITLQGDITLLDLSTGRSIKAEFVARAPSEGTAAGSRGALQAIFGAGARSVLTIDERGVLQQWKLSVPSEPKALRAWVQENAPVIADAKPAR